MKPDAEKTKKPRTGPAAAKPCCGTLTLMAEGRGAKRPEPARRMNPPGELTMIRKNHTAFV